MLRLIDEFDAADGGVTTDIDIECPHCALIQTVQLPFGKDFFLPKPKKKSKETEEETGQTSGTPAPGSSSP